MDQRVSAGNGFASIAFEYPKAVPGRSPDPLFETEVLTK